MCYVPRQAMDNSHVSLVSVNLLAKDVEMHQQLVNAIGSVSLRFVKY